MNTSPVDSALLQSWSAASLPHACVVVVVAVVAVAVAVVVVVVDCYCWKSLLLLLFRLPPA